MSRGNLTGIERGTQAGASGPAGPPGQDGSGVPMWGQIIGDLPTQPDLVDALNAREPVIAPGTVAQYWCGDKTWRDFATDVRAAVLTGLSLASAAVVAATDSVLVAIGKLAATSVPRGTAFPIAPAAPVANDQFYRTDLNLHCYFDGTRWLTVQEYELGGLDLGGASFAAASTVKRIPVRSDFALWLTRWSASTYVQVTNSGTAYWTATLSRVDGANSVTAVQSFNTGADTVAQWTQHGASINAALAAGAKELHESIALTGAPGATFYTSSLYARLIVT